LQNKPERTHNVQQGYAGSYTCPAENLVQIVLKILKSKQTKETTGSTDPLQRAILLHSTILWTILQLLGRTWLLTSRCQAPDRAERVDNPNVQHQRLGQSPCKPTPNPAGCGLGGRCSTASQDVCSDHCWAGNTTSHKHLWLHRTREMKLRIIRIFAF